MLVFPFSRYRGSLLQAEGEAGTAADAFLCLAGSVLPVDLEMAAMP